MVWLSSDPAYKRGDFVWCNDEADALILDHTDIEDLPKDMELRFYGKEPQWPSSECVPGFLPPGAIPNNPYERQFMEDARALLN